MVLTILGMILILDRRSQWCVVCYVLKNSHSAMKIFSEGVTFSLFYFILFNKHLAGTGVPIHVLSRFLGSRMAVPGLYWRTKNRRKHSKQHGASQGNDHGGLFVFVSSTLFYFFIFVSKDGPDA
jgi:hypothetical protein